MKKNTRKETEIGRKKIGITLYGVNTIVYEADIVVEAPADMTEAELTDAFNENWDNWPELRWKEHNDDGIARIDEPSVWDVGDEIVPQFIVQRDGNGDIIVFPSGGNR